LPARKDSGIKKIVPDPDDQIAASVDSLLKKLGVSPESLSGILADTDWAFYIKIFAMVEASINHLLLNHFADSRLEKLITRMDLSDKMEFVKALEFLPDKTRAFIKNLSEVRNKIAHGLGGLRFNLVDYLTTKLDPQQRKNLLDGVRSLVPGIRADAMWNKDPRGMLFMAVCVTLSQIESCLPRPSPDPSLPPDAREEAKPKG